MGYYINPPVGTKEDWLARNGQQVNIAVVREMPWSDLKDKMFVCLVDNGPFTAAGIAYSDRERKAFLLPDHRPQKWYMVPRSDLEPWCPREAMEA